MNAQKKWDQRQTVTAIALIAILLNILVTKVMLQLNPALDAQNDASLINKIYFVILGVAFVFLLWKGPLKMRWDALKPGSKKEFLREMAQAAGISAALIVLMILCRLILNAKNPEVNARPFFGLYLGIHGRWFYPFSAVLQELVIKGLMQDNFRCLSPDGNRHFTVMVNAIFFACLHMNFPLYYLIGAGILCAGTGYLYERDRNIWGSALIHFVIGFMPRALGLK
ncbi:MAG: CPBP family intramembrane metalloprotease [Clostridia bacterium]|nr:CPBP family intramembrane metalloprotease [Clostridia bacterium]